MVDDEKQLPRVTQHFLCHGINHLRINNLPVNATAELEIGQERLRHCCAKNFALRTALAQLAPPPLPLIRADEGPRRQRFARLSLVSDSADDQRLGASP